MAAGSTGSAVWRERRQGDGSRGTPTPPPAPCRSCRSCRSCTSCRFAAVGHGGKAGRRLASGGGRARRAHRAGRASRTCRTPRASPPPSSSGSTRGPRPRAAGQCKAVPEGGDVHPRVGPPGSGGRASLQSSPLQRGELWADANEKERGAPFPLHGRRVGDGGGGSRCGIGLGDVSEGSANPAASTPSPGLSPIRQRERSPRSSLFAPARRRATPRVRAHESAAACRGGAKPGEANP